MSTSAPSSRSSSVATTGKRPTNSGMRPNFSRSSGSRSLRISPVLRSSGPRTPAPKRIAALGRPRGDGAFHDLQKRLLHALARHVARDRGVVGFAADLVDLVDIDDAAL